MSLKIQSALGNKLKRQAITAPSASTEPATKKTKTVVANCSCTGCEFFASINGKCSSCAKGKHVTSKVEHNQVPYQEAKSTLKPLHPRLMFPLIVSCKEKDTTFKQFLIKVGEISQSRGPGERFIEQAFVCRKKRKLALIHDEKSKPQQVDEFVIHRIENEGAGRYAIVTFYMHGGQRLKAGWLEEADGTVTSHYG
jgi:hypothetical protein